MSMKNIGSDEVLSELTGIQPGDVQPNAVDLRLGKVFRILPRTFVIDENQKGHRGTQEVFTQTHGARMGYFYLTPGHYEVIMENQIKVGDNEAGFVITRSTLNRNGVFLTSGLYDTGYEGLMAAVMHVTVDDMLIAPGTRIGQYLSFDAQALHHYDGDYGHGKEHDKKYGAASN